MQNNPVLKKIGVIVWLCCLGGCLPTGSGPALAPRSSGANDPGGIRLQAVVFNDPISPTPSDQPIDLTAAKNEWTNFAMQITSLPATSGRRNYSLRVEKLVSAEGATIDPGNYSAFQILSMPIDVNRAGFVRHTGLGVGKTEFPRALLPMPINGGEMSLAAARDPKQPTNSKAHAGGSAEPALFWIDVHVPPEAKPGDYTANCQILENGQTAAVASVQVKLTVYDFVLPDERHLTMVSRIDWEELRRLYPSFESVEPYLISRGDKNCAPAIATLDALQKLAQINRTEVVIPRMEPIVKWPAGAPPQVDWSAFDSVVSPWLKGDVFADKVPLGFWPMPKSENLDSYPIPDRLAYWAAAASHFGQLGWLKQTAIFLDDNRTNQSAKSIELSNLASRLLNAQAGIRVMLPLEEGEIQLADKSNLNFVDPQSVDRLMVASPGLVSASPVRVWPNSMPQAMHWLRTDLPGLVPYVGAGGDEHDVRLWAWLAFLRKQAQLILWDNPLPRTSSPTEPADPNDLVWFYPGSWFGVDQPVPSVQLKWLRRAQQDYEYLWLAKQRGQLLNAMLMARLITKPVEIEPTQSKDPEYALMSGTADPRAWTDAMNLLAKNILASAPGQGVNPAISNSLDLELLRWAKPLERPTIIGRTTNFVFDPTVIGNGTSISLQLGIDIYNASDANPDKNTLQWMQPSCFIVRPQPTIISALQTYRIRRLMLDAQLDPSRIVNTDHKPIELVFTEPNYKLTTPVKMVVPVSISDRHPPGLQIDGSLEDWTADDAIQDGPLVQLFNRPALQAQKMLPASVPSNIYTGWSDDNFYVAFKVQGLSQAPAKATQNFVTYQFRRAWGEDLCQLLIQPIYRDNSAGPVLHVAVKPNGGVWIERKGDAQSVDPWPAFEGAGIRYKATLDGPIWRGEIALPWKSITGELPAAKGKGKPIMLRFNFVQHRTENGESASWAGPIDFGRDDRFMGLIVIRDSGNAGVAAGP